MKLKNEFKPVFWGPVEQITFAKSRRVFKVSLRRDVRVIIFPWKTKLIIDQIMTFLGALENHLRQARAVYSSHWMIRVNLVFKKFQICLVQYDGNLLSGHVLKGSINTGISLKNRPSMSVKTVRAICYTTIMFGRVTYARRRLRRERFSVYLIHIL